MKIAKVEVINYRGYKHAVFDFTNGLNTFIGSGNSGKSAAQKAIKFVLKNDQTGNIESDWILDKERKIKKGEKCSVTIYTDTGYKVKREKTRSENFYQINDNPPIKNLPRSGVPVEIEALFNISDVNLQSQFESHFLLSETSSKVAKTLNANVGLEIMDESISNVKSIMRKNKKEYDASQANVAKYEKEFSTFDFIEDMEKDVEELSLLYDRKTEVEKNIILLQHASIIIGQHKEKLKQIDEVLTHKGLVTIILDLYEKFQFTKEDIEDLQDIKESIEDLENDIESFSNIIENKNLAELIIALYEKKASIDDNFNKLCDCEENIEKLKKKIASYDTIINHKSMCEDILLLYEKSEQVKSNKTTLKEIYRKINKLTEEIKNGAVEIEKEFDKIKGLACPICGNIINDVKRI